MSDRFGINASACLAISVQLASCASTPALSEGATLQINQMLDQVSTHYAEEGARNCLPTSLYREVEIIDERRLIFRGRADRAWLNEFRHRCSGIRRDDTLLFELHSSSICALDSVSVIDRSLLWSRSGTVCILGKFKPIPPGYAELIDDLLHGKQGEVGSSTD